MKWFDNTSLTLVIIGAVNWLLIGIFRFDLVTFLFGNFKLDFKNHLYCHWSVWSVSDQSLWQNWQYGRFLTI